MNKFRLLRADEIDCRIAQIREDGLSLLLYKDARVDQNILDETVGEMNWQKSYSRENANCTVSIWDEAKKMWISKEDTGTESNTEKEKGLASDSFKRACFCWGIGRELYSAPSIWIKPEDCRTFYKNQSGKLTCNDHFYVSRIEYSDARNIIALEIMNRSTGKVVYRLGSQRPAVASAPVSAAPATNQAPTAPAAPSAASVGVPVNPAEELLVNSQMIQTIRSVAAELNIKEPKVMMVANANRRKRNARTTSQLEDLTVDDFKYLMDAFKQQRVALQRRAQMEAQREALQTA
nr:MAG TPA: Rad52/22 family double-strand break repair protein [Caudoviricetes sp.]